MAGPFGTGLSVTAMARQQAQRDLERNALESLILFWGEAYDITVTGGLWAAVRRDGRGGPLEADSPEKLGREILDDHLTLPVQLGHDAEPRPGTVYSDGVGPNTGHPANPDRERHYPMTGHCTGCEGMIRRDTIGDGWEHTGRAPGEG